jgi:hypothetical protein
MLLFTSTIQSEAGLDLITQSPKDSGRVELIVCRPAVGKRQELNLMNARAIALIAQGRER